MRFKTGEFSMAFGDIDVVLTTIENLDELFDELVQKGENHPDVQDERIPYWAELWASAIGMAQVLVENRLITEGVSVTEIGCGLGLPGIVAGKLGGNVTLTDYDDDALQFAKMNWERNFSDKTARFQRLDWRKPDPSVAADVLLASDVAYEKRAFEPLLSVFEKLLNPNGTIVISEPNRPVSRDFFRNMPTHGYQTQHLTKTVERRGQAFVVNIYVLKRAAI